MSVFDFAKANLGCMGGSKRQPPCNVAVEGVSTGYIDPYVGCGFEDFVPFVIIVTVLFIRPYGLFGEKAIEVM